MRCVCKSQVALRAVVQAAQIFETMLCDGGVKANPSAHSASGMACCELHRQPLERCGEVDGAGGAHRTDT